MMVEENKALVRRIAEEAWGQGNLAVLDELLATNFLGMMQQLGVVPPPG